MNDAEIKSEIRFYLMNNSLPGTELDKLRDDDSFLESELIDSTGVLELVAFVEDKFSVSVNDDEISLENLDSINRLIGFIQSKLGKLKS
jgi:acyl carrier protein